MCKTERIYIMDMKLRYKYFLARLKYELDKLGHGGKSYIGKNIGKSGSFIGQLIDPNAHKKASVDTQIAIAEFISGSEEKFIQEGLEYEEYGVIKDELVAYINELGKKHPSPHPQLPAPVSIQDESDKRHAAVIAKFENKDFAVELNEMLVEIEKLEGTTGLVDAKKQINYVLMAAREKRDSLEYKSKR